MDANSKTLQLIADQVLEIMGDIKDIKADIKDIKIVLGMHEKDIKDIRELRVIQGSNGASRGDG